MSGSGSGGLWSQDTAGKGIWISIEQYRITRNEPAIAFKLISARFAAFKPCNTAIIMKISAQIFGAGLHAIGQLFHTTFDMPNAQAFHMPDQSKQRWRGLRQAPNLGGVTGKELCQPRLGKPTCEGLGQRPQGIHHHKCARRF